MGKSLHLPYPNKNKMLTQYGPSPRKPSRSSHFGGSLTGGSTVYKCSSNQLCYKLFLTLLTIPPPSIPQWRLLVTPRSLTRGQCLELLKAGNSCISEKCLVFSVLLRPFSMIHCAGSSTLTVSPSQSTLTS